MSGVAHELWLHADGSFSLLYRFARLAKRDEWTGTWVANADIVELTVQANEGNPLQAGTWRRHFSIMSDGRLRAPWWDPSDGDFHMFTWVPKDRRP